MVSISISFLFLFFLFLCHYLADYPLQGDFLSRAKNHKSPIGVPWRQAMTAHASIHAGLMAIAVLLFSAFVHHDQVEYAAMIALGAALFEFSTHFAIDYTKCAEKISFTADQIAHYVVIVIIWAATLFHS